MDRQHSTAGDDRRIPLPPDLEQVVERHDLTPEPEPAAAELLATVANLLDLLQEWLSEDRAGRMVAAQPSLPLGGGWGREEMLARQARRLGSVWAGLAGGDGISRIGLEWACGWLRDELGRQDAPARKRPDGAA